MTSIFKKIDVRVAKPVAEIEGTASAPHMGAALLARPGTERPGAETGAGDSLLADPHDTVLPLDETAQPERRAEDGPGAPDSASGPVGDGPQDDGDAAGETLPAEAAAAAPAAPSPAVSSMMGSASTGAMEAVQARAPALTEATDAREGTQAASADAAPAEEASAMPPAAALAMPATETPAAPVEAPIAGTGSYVYRDAGDTAVHELDPDHLGVGMGCMCASCCSGLSDSGTGSGSGSGGTSAPTTTGSIQTLANYLNDGFWGGDDRRFDLGTGGDGQDVAGRLWYRLAGSSYDADGVGDAGVREDIRDAFRYIGEITGITFSEAVNAGIYNHDEIDFYFTDNVYTSTGGNRAFNSTTQHKDFFFFDNGWIDYNRINISDGWAGGSSGIGSYTFQTAVHEILHGMGLGHQGQYNAAPGVSITYGNDAEFRNDSWQLSTMSYFTQDENTWLPSATTSQYLLTPAAADFQALNGLYAAQGYGMSNAFNGNTTYGMGTNITLDALDNLVNFADDYSFTIVDADGFDTVDFRNHHEDAFLNLRVVSASHTDSNPSSIGGRVGNMTLAVGTVIERAYTGNGDDEIYGNDAGNWFFGNFGDDTLYGYNGNDFLYGEEGEDFIVAHDGNDYISGGDGDDTLQGMNDNDTVHGGAGDDWVYGQNGNDSLTGSLGNDRMYGGNDQDTIRGGDGLDTIYGEAGNDSLDGDNGNDWISAGSGNDTVEGGSGNDTLYGSGGNDSLLGQDGNDRLEGMDGNDTMRGGNGNDTLLGGAGVDHLFGDDGDDTFLYTDGATGGTFSSNEQINGGANSATGRDRILLDVAGNEIFDFRPTNISGIEEIEFSAENTGATRSLYLYGKELDSAAELGGDLLIDSGASDYDNIFIWAEQDSVAYANFNLSGWSFQDWDFGAFNDNIFIYGHSGANSITGTIEEDYIYGNDGNDSLGGAGGDDTMYGGDGNDTMTGGNGDDLLYGQNDNDRLFGNAGNDTLDGDAGNDSLEGWSGNDLLRGDAGIDTLRGGDGDDSLYGGDGTDYLYGDAGNDYLRGDDGVSYKYGGDGDDTLAYIGGVGFGATGTLDGDGNTLLGRDRLLLGGTDTFIYQDFRDFQIAGIEEIEFAQLSDSTQFLYLWSREMDTPDELGGSLLIDSASFGYDRIYIYLEHDGSTLYRTIDMSGWTFQSWDFGTYDDIIYISGTALADTITASIEDDTIIGGDGDDFIDAEAGDDEISGGNGDDLLIGGAGADTINGGLGTNTASYQTASAGVVASLLAPAGNTGDAAGDSYFFIQNLTGSAHNDLLTGDTGDNVIHGLNGDDTINGGAGDDELRGGNGDDVVNGEAGDDTVLGGNGDDLLRGQLGADFLAGWTGSDTLLGGDGDDTLWGEAGADMLYGWTGDDSMEGGDGGDTLRGEGGDDSLDGGLGVDEMIGGAGDDSYWVNLAGDTVTEAAGQGIDTVHSLVTRSLSANVENLTLLGTGDIDGDGNALDNILRGNAGNNILRGFNGDDTLNGFAGDDELRGGNGDDILWGGLGDDAVLGGAGNDILRGEGGDDFVAGWTGADTLLGGAGADTLLGEDGADMLYGWTGDDLLEGGAGNDTLRGEGGNDVLDGGLGLDEMAGGTGNDIYLVNAAGDTVIEAAGEGVDLVRSTVTHSLAANVENLVLLGIGNNDGFGNALANVMTGNAGGNLINGGAGNDTINGVDGADELRGADGNDLIRGGNGSDTIFGGNGNDALWGQAGNDVMAGWNGNDSLEGLNGNDSMLGEAGLDTLRGGNGNDTARGGEGDDLLFGGNNDDRLFGEAGDDTLWGGNGDDSLEGLNGHDSLLGEAGVDTLRGGNGLDSLFGGDGEDLMFGGNHNDLMYGGNQNDTMFGGNGDDTINGNAGDDILEGGNGADILNGGIGADNFRFTNVAQSDFFNRDLIQGFDGAGAAAGDRIGLAQIDADWTTPGDQAFIYYGVMTVAQGQAQGPGALWSQNDGGSTETLLFGNLDADPGLEFALRIQDGGVLASAYTVDDFFL